MEASNKTTIPSTQTTSIIITPTTPTAPVIATPTTPVITILTSPTPTPIIATSTTPTTPVFAAPTTIPTPIIVTSTTPTTPIIATPTTPVTLVDVNPTTPTTQTIPITPINTSPKIITSTINTTSTPNSINIKPSLLKPDTITSPSSITNTNLNIQTKLTSIHAPIITSNISFTPIVSEIPNPLPTPIIINTNPTFINTTTPINTFTTPMNTSTINTNEIPMDLDTSTHHTLVNTKHNSIPVATRNPIANNAITKAKKKTKGRQKIEMKMIQDEDSRLITFSKRRYGIYKKTSELVTLCGAEVGIVIFSPSGKPFSYGHPSIDAIASHFLLRQTDPQTAAMFVDVATHPIVEAHRRVRINDLNQQYNNMSDDLDAEKETLKEFKKLTGGSTQGMIELAPESKGWWDASIEGLSLDELKQRHKTLEDIYANISKQIEERMTKSSLSFNDSTTYDNDLHSIGTYVSGTCQGQANPFVNLVEHLNASGIHASHQCDDVVHSPMSG